VIHAGISRVVVAMADPDPRVAGGGMARLRAAGLEVIEAVAEADALRLNRAFVHRVRTGRPLGILKWAMSLDGRTALPNGQSQWISGPKARDWVHRLRADCDAVIVGGGTVRADNPLLTSRGRRHPEPLRVVLSRSLDLPEAAQLWDTTVAPTLVAHGPEAPQERQLAFDRLAAAAGDAEHSHAAGAQPAAPDTPAGGLQRLELASSEPAALLEALAERGCNRVLWECGPELAATALRQGCVQELAVVIAPKLLGGKAARTPLGDLGLKGLDEAQPWERLEQRDIGIDTLWKLSIPEPTADSAGPSILGADTARTESTP
jgi:diaminohydroxyphosphoribosylaminopyrimidine deaminase/5-amino-6-(5-phosphoribosylamino)uracil reductase